MKAGLSFVLLVTVIFVSLGLYLFSGRGEPSEVGEWKVKADDYDEDAVVLSWNGSIDPPMAKALLKEFQNRRGAASKFIIQLNSSGGSLAEGDDVIRVINRMKTTHTVWTYVGPGNDCLSMCVPIYLQGRTRIAAPSSNWLFHDVSTSDKITGAKTIMYSNEQGQANLMFIYKYIDRSDINPEWRERLKSSMKYGDVWKTGQELKDERSNIITILE